jgi:hypothetical protein
MATALPGADPACAGYLLRFFLAIAPGGFASVDMVIRPGNAEVPGRRRLHPTAGARTMSMTRVIRFPALGLSGWAIVDAVPAPDLGSDMLGEPSVWWQR